MRHEHSLLLDVTSDGVLTSKVLSDASLVGTYNVQFLLSLANVDSELWSGYMLDLVIQVDVVSPSTGPSAETLAEILSSLLREEPQAEEPFAEAYDVLVDATKSF